ncbi:type II toxin-antitoxin system RelE family toxin [Candidatus Pyrohabitans sp.]
MKYKLKFTKAFQKNIKKFRKNKEIVEGLMGRIEKIIENPDCGKPLKYALSSYRSVRVKSRYRLIYKVDEERKEVILVAFGHRKRIYEVLLLSEE